MPNKSKCNLYPFLSFEFIFPYCVIEWMSECWNLTEKEGKWWKCFDVRLNVFFSFATNIASIVLFSTEFVRQKCGSMLLEGYTLDNIFYVCDNADVRPRMLSATKFAKATNKKKKQLWRTSLVLLLFWCIDSSQFSFRLTKYEAKRKTSAEKDEFLGWFVSSSIGQWKRECFFYEWRKKKLFTLSDIT